MRRELFAKRIHIHNNYIHTHTDRDT